MVSVTTGGILLLNKYLVSDEEQWQSLSDTPAYKPAIMNSLKQGILYELRVVVIRSQSGEAIESAIKKYRPGSGN